MLDAATETAGAGMLVAPPVTYEDFQKTLHTAKPSVSADALEEFDKFTKEFGMDG
jgi:hypothetical protein